MRALARVALACCALVPGTAAAGVVSEEMARVLDRWLSRDVQRQGGVVARDGVADWIGMSRQDLADLVALGTEAMGDGDAMVRADLPPAQRALVDEASLFYAHDCGNTPLKDILRFVPVPDPPAPDAAIVCAAVHDGMVLAVKIALKVPK